MYHIARLFVFSVLPYLIISDKRRYTTNTLRHATLTSHVKNDAGEYCSDNSHCLNDDCRGNRCGGRAEGQWCSENDWCSDRNCYRGACHGKDAYKDIGESCNHRRECISTRCSDGTCVGRTNGSWCQKNEWCASNHCFKTLCEKKPFDPCSSRSTAEGCNGNCAWSNGQCAYSECEVWCGNHQAPSCDLCPSGHGASWCKGNCAWYNGNCLSPNDLPDPCNAIDDAKKCIGECAWSNGVCSYSETHVNCGEHQAPSCSLCPSGHGNSWCSGECNWLNGECFRDVALDGSASQSSDNCWAMRASQAINGNTSGDCGTHQCTHTALEHEPWWKVDLHNIYLINTIVIWNRSDCCMFRLNNAELKIYRDDILVDTKNLGDMGDTKKKEFNYSGISGDIVKVQLTHYDYLQLAEVQVFGLRDVALDGTASQSSEIQNHDDFDMRASKAINGNTSGNCLIDQCSHTHNEYRPWWKVDLHNIYLIHTIVIWNRSDCCMDRLNNAELKIYRDDILVDTKNLGDMGDTRKKEFNYSGISGNIVKVQSPGTQSLQLSEVQVFGSLQ